MQYLIDRDYASFVEFGPGGVLAGLMKRIDRRFRKIPSIATWQDVQEFVSELA